MALGSLKRYLVVVAAIAVAVVFALGMSGWPSEAGGEWLMLGAAIPAGIGGALLGDRVGLWLKEQGLGRQ